MYVLYFVEMMTLCRIPQNLLQSRCVIIMIMMMMIIIIIIIILAAYLIITECLHAEYEALKYF